jgi:hypothetical protein
VLNLNLPSRCQIPSHISWGLTLKVSTKGFKPHTRTHHVVIIVIIVIITMLTLCYSIMSHATLIIYYHVCCGCHMHDIREARMYHQTVVGEQHTWTLTLNL